MNNNTTTNEAPLNADWNVNNNMGTNENMGMGMNQNQMAMNMNMMGVDLNMMVQPNQFQPTWTVSNGVTHLNITAIGQKVEPGNSCCALLTCLFGICLIFPLFFTCCMWWKKIVYPKYEAA